MADSTATRRRLIGLGATVLAGLAGCSGGGGGRGRGGQGGNGGDRSGQGLGPVPEEYETATGLGGQTRDPGGVATKQTVSYQSTPNGDDQCSNCLFYIQDKNDDGLGACTIVEGKIEPEGWCVNYSPYRG